MAYPDSLRYPILKTWGHSWDDAPVMASVIGKRFLLCAGSEQKVVLAINAVAHAAGLQEVAVF